MQLKFILENTNAKLFYLVENIFKKIQFKLFCLCKVIRLSKIYGRFARMLDLIFLLSSEFKDKIPIAQQDNNYFFLGKHSQALFN